MPTHPDSADTAQSAQVTTTGRTSKPSSHSTPNETRRTTGVPTTVQPGTDPVRPVNPDPHGVPGATQSTEASKLEAEVEQGRENRY